MRHTKWEESLDDWFGNKEGGRIESVFEGSVFRILVGRFELVRAGDDLECRTTNHFEFIL